METNLPPMRDWIMRPRLSARFYALVLAGAASAESLPSCSLDSLPLEPGRAILECVLPTGDTLWVWPASNDYQSWGYDLVGTEWVAVGDLVWGPLGEAILCPISRKTSRECSALVSPEDVQEPSGQI